MSLTIITECDNITICETITNGSVFDYIMTVMNDFDDVRDIVMNMIINIGDKLITIRLK